MYQVSNDYLNTIQNTGRDFYSRITILSTGTVISADFINDISFEDVVNSEDVLTMGSVCSNKVEINLRSPSASISYDNKKIQVEIGLLVNGDYEYVPMGTFIVTDTETGDDYRTVKLTAYDSICLLTKKYEPLTSISTVAGLYNDLRTQLLSDFNITFEATVQNYAINMANLPENATMIEVLGYLAGLNGSYAHIDRDGILRLKYFATNSSQPVITITRAMQELDGVKLLTNSQVNITSLVSGTEDNPIVSSSGSSGTTISFTNPLMTQQILDAIYDRTVALGITYQPASVKWIGNPALEAGDKIRIIDGHGNYYNILVMSQDIGFDGGMGGEIRCVGQSQSKSELTTRHESATETIKKQYRSLQNAIKNATELITGNDGGYVVFHSRGAMTSVTDTSSLGVSVDSAMFADHLHNAGNYVFTYNGSEWQCNGITYSLSTIGINLSSHPSSGDSFTVSLSYQSEFPDEILIMDAPSIAEATKVWRWNQSGLGYSSHGYDGPYGLAMTKDGAIVADFITSGTMSADRIFGGTLTLGGQNDDYGTLIMKDRNNSTMGRWDKDGLQVGSDFFVRYDEDEGEMETYIGGFWAYTAASLAHYLATTDQSVGMGDHPNFSFWAGDASNNPPFYVNKNGQLVCKSLLIWDENGQNPLVIDTTGKINNIDITALSNRVTALETQVGNIATALDLINGEII